MHQSQSSHTTYGERLMGGSNGAAIVINSKDQNFSLDHVFLGPIDYVAH